MLVDTCFDVYPRTMTNTGFLTGRYPATVTVGKDTGTLYVGDDLITTAMLRVYNASTGVASSANSPLKSVSIARADSPFFGCSLNDFQYSCSL